MNSIVTYFTVVLVIGLSSLQGRVEAQETIISKKDADYVFSLTRPEWEKDSQKFFVPGWVKKSTKHETGVAVMGFDQSTGFGLSVQPFFQNDDNPPHLVIVGNYFPIRTLPPMTDELKKDMEVAAQKDLGLMYSVRLNYTKMEKIEAIELILTKKK
ncbi:MAG: hypothetical protein HY574_01620 [candidate division NC10 bacterium]|nr:hypothetical protein [candidate division NC10 bacterium]